MALDLSVLFGQQPDYSGLISPEEQKRLQSNASQQALLNGVIALLGASGPRPYPIGTGQALAGALGAGAEGYNQSFDRTLKQMVTGMQLEDYKRKRQAQDLARQAFTRTPQPIPMATGEGSQLEMLSRPEFGGDMAVPETRAALMANLPTKMTLDESKLIEAAAMESPIEALKLMSKEDKAPASVKEYEYAVSKGYKGSFDDWKRLNAPGTNVSVNMGKDLSVLQPILKDAQIAAQGSTLQIDAADRVLGAVESGKIIAGPFATPQLRLAQIGQTLGLTGQNTAETVANTRQAIRGFAELTLQGRKSMRGEGSITESEGKAAEKAFSGNIDDLTVEEIKLISNASKRVAQYNIDEYNRKLDIIGKNPQYKDIIDFYRITPIAPMTRPGAVKKFNPATGKVE